MQSVPATRTCPRCEVPVGEGSCQSCGRPRFPRPDEIQRQERYLIYRLGAVAAHSEPLSALNEERNRAQERLRWLLPLPPPTLAQRTLAPMKPSTEPPEEPSAAAPVEISVERRGLQSPAPASHPPPSSQLDPVSAREKLERRLELGGWFVGALFCIGGALWATHLFWGDIPESLRPAVVGVGIAVFAAAFMWIGALLHRRHPLSLSGPVLQTVGLIIAAASTWPLSRLFVDGGAWALLVNAAVACGLTLVQRTTRFSTYRSTYRKSDHPQQATVKGSDAGSRTGDGVFFAVAFVLATLVAQSDVAALALGGAAWIWARIAISQRTARALQGEAVWMRDAGTLALAGAATIVAISASTSLLVLLPLSAWAAETVARLLEQRPRFFSILGIARVVSAVVLGGLLLLALGLALTSPATLTVGLLPWLLAGTLAPIAVFFLEPHRASLSAGMWPIGATVAACAVAFVVVPPLALVVPGPAPSLFATVVLVLLLGWQRSARRSPTLEPSERATLAFLQAAGFVFAAAQPVLMAGPQQDSAVTSMALAAAALAFVDDRRFARSLLWALTAVAAVGCALLFFLRGIPPWHAGAVVVVVAALSWAWLVRNARPAHSSDRPAVHAGGPALFLALVGLSAVACFGLVFDSESSWVMALLAGLVGVAATAATRMVTPGVWGASVWAAVLFAWLDRQGLLEVQGPLLPLALTTLAVSVLAFGPAPRSRSIRALPAVFNPLGRSPRALPWSFHLVAHGLLLLSTVAAIVLSTSTPVAPVSSAVLVAAAALLWLRAPSSAALTILMAQAMLFVTVWALGTTWLGDRIVLAGPSQAGLALQLGALFCAAAAWLLKQASGGVGRIHRLQRRARAHPPAQGAELLWGLSLASGVLGPSLLVVGLPGLAPDVATWVAEASVFVCAATALVLYATRPLAILASVAGVALVIAPLPRLFAGVSAGSHGAALLAALTMVGVVLLLHLLARRAHHAARLGLRAIAWPALVVQATAVVGLALLVRGDFLAESAAFGHASFILAFAVGVTAVLALQLEKNRKSLLLAAAVLTSCGVAICQTLHALGLRPPSHGVMAGFGALLLLCGAWAIEQPVGRRLLIGVGLGMPAALRRLARRLFLAGGVAAVSIGTLLAARDAPLVQPLTWLVCGAAGMLLFALHPTRHTSVALVVGSVIAGSGVGSILAVAFWLRPLDEHGLPLVMASALLVLFAVRAVVTRTGVRDAIARLAGPARVEPNLRGLHEALPRMRIVIDVGAGLLFLPVVLLALHSVRVPVPTLLASWAAAVLCCVLWSRSAEESRQPLLAAIAQGAALAVYVDLRRRTEWLDGGATDAISLLLLALTFLAIRTLSRFSSKRSAVGGAFEFYAATLPLVAAGLSPSPEFRVLILMAAGGLYAGLAARRRTPFFEVCAGAVFALAAVLTLHLAGARSWEMFLMPVAVTTTFLARRHRQRWGRLGRSLAVLSQVPVYCTAAWSALSTGRLLPFALAVVFVGAGVAWAIWNRDRRALYAAVGAALVLVVGRLLLLGLAHALVGTLLLAGTGIALLAAMTLFTLRRDATRAMLQKTRLDYSHPKGANSHPLGVNRPYIHDALAWSICFNPSEGRVE